MARKHLPDNPVRVVGRTFNWREAVLNAATFGLFIGCVEAYSHDVEPLIVLLGAVAMVAVGFVYVRMQVGKKYPMLPLDLLKIPIFTTSVATSVISFTAQMLVMVGMPFMLVTTFGYNAVGTGLLMTSWPLAIIFVAPLAGWLVGRVHPGILGGIGLSMLSVGCFLLSFIPADTDHFGLVWRLMLCGAGFGFFQSPNNHLLLSSAPRQRQRHAGHGPPDRPDARRGPRGHALPSVRPHGAPRRHAPGGLPYGVRGGVLVPEAEGTDGRVSGSQGPDR